MSQKGNFMFETTVQLRKTRSILIQNTHRETSSNPIHVGLGILLSNPAIQHSFFTNARSVREAYCNLTVCLHE